MPSSTGSTASRCDGLATTETVVACSPSGVVNLPVMPRWYFTSPEPCADFGSRCPSNSEKIFSYGLPTMLASTLSRPRWAMPMTTSSRSASAEAWRISSSSGISDSPPSSENRFWPTYLVCRKVSNASAALSRLRMCFCSSADGLVYLLLDPLLDPAPLLRVLDVHVLDADPAAVRVAQHAEDVAQLHLLLAGEAADRERAVEVPQGQAVLEHVEVGVLADLELERVGVGHEVAAHPVGVDQLDDPGGLVDLALGRCAATSRIQRTGSYGMRSEVKISS